MKKLVTIVSAVMMLLMLAACAPTIDYSAEDVEQIRKGQAALSAIIEYAKQEYTDEKAELEEGEEMPSPWKLSLTAKADAGTYTIEAGTSVEFTLAEGKTIEDFMSGKAVTNLEVKGSVTGDFGGEEEETVSVVYYTTADEMGPFKVNGKGYSPALIGF